MQDQPVSTQPSRRLNPWKAIWTRPQEALDYVLRRRREDFIHRLYIVHGFFFMLSLRLPDWHSTSADPVGVMIQLLLIGPFLGLFLGYLQTTMQGVCSRWMDDPMDKQLLRPAQAWTNLPFIGANFVFQVAYLALAGARPQGMGGYEWLISAPEGWVVTVITVLAALYAIITRIRAFSLLFDGDRFLAFMVWSLAWLLSYLPLAAVVFMYAMAFYASIARPGQ